MAGIYVHIPFCARRCIYCGFFSTMREGEAARYVNALCAELRQRRDYLRGETVKTVYFGGGTPSRLTPGQIGQVIDAIRSDYGLDSLEELTVECNPDDITPAYIACKESGINNISIDLMYGLPGQTDDIQQRDLEAAVSLDVSHISSYCLSYEEGSPLERMRNHGRITPADDDLCAQMYERMCAHLHQAGFDHYEISNFCRPGFHSLHNSSYWDGTPYLGVGAGAHSYNRTSRQWNPNDLDAYMSGIEQGAPEFQVEQLSATDRYNEKIMLSLRTSKGLNLSLLTPSDRKSLLESAHNMLSDGTLKFYDGYLSIPEKNMFISDSIISSLFR